MKALIVDDNILNLKVAQKLLEKKGVTIETALSGFECLEKIENNKYDVIFMDIMMPEMDGIDTYKKLKQIEGFNIPVIALTADADIGSKEKYLNLGFYDYIAKPIQITIIDDIVNKIRK